MNFQISNYRFNDFLKRSIYFGLIFSHFITSIYWLKNESWIKYSTENYKTTCFPLFKNCFELAFENLIFIQSIFVLYLLFCLLGLFLVVIDKSKLYLLIFTGLTVLKLFVLLSRYSFMGNYHNMHLSLCILTLISAGSFTFFRLGLVLQYVFAGLLKLNIEWLSGAALVSYSPYMFRGFWNSMSLAYVPVLELILIWGLLSKHSILRRVTIVQLIAFHLYSILIVGLYYPLIMAGLLLPIITKEFTNTNSDTILYNKIGLKQLAPLFFVFFMVLWNISTKLYTLDPSMDGNISYLSLNMLDAKLKCQHTLLEEKPDGTILALNIPKIATAIRVHCDALVFESFLKRLCIQNPKSKFMFYLESARTTDDKYTLVRKYNNVCEEI